MNAARTGQLEWVGRGRAASVYVGRDSRGRRVAHKVFTPDSLSSLVFYALDGAPNPYGWNEHALSAALARRRLLAHLVEFWFGERLALPATYGSSWNEPALAYELRCEFIEGRHIPLRGRESRASDGWLEDLVENILRPLQQHLEEAGLDGLVWQAGRGPSLASTCRAAGSMGALSSTTPTRVGCAATSRSGARISRRSSASTASRTCSPQ